MAAVSQSRWRPWWRWLVPIAAGLATVLVFEIGLRIADKRREQRFWTFRMHDATRGSALRPGYAGWATIENKVWVQINSDGMRDREHPIAKAPGTVRVTVLGDSYMQAMNVPLEKAFTSFLERRLSDCVRPASREAEVLNFGVSGYGTAQELITYRDHVIKYRPDIVVLAVYTSNDIYNNHRELSESHVDGTPYFVLEGNTLVLDAPTPPVDEAGVPWYQQVRLAVTTRLAAANLVYNGWAQLRARFAPRPAAAAEPADARDEADADEIYRPPATPEARDAWRVTEALFLTLAREVAAQGSQLWIVTLANSEQVDPNPEARRAFAARLGVESLTYPDLRIRDFARANGIPVVTLVEPLADYAEKTGTFLNGGYNLPPGEGHWNETANALAAGLVGDRLCAEAGILTPRRN